MQIATSGLGAILAWIVLLICVVLICFIVLMGAEIPQFPLVVLVLVGVLAVARNT